MKAITALMLAAALAAPAFSHADEEKKAETKPLKVLMIGNSFSMSVMQQTPAVAKSLGCELDICSMYIGGCPFSRHAANLKTDAAPYGVGWSYRGDRRIDAVPQTFKDAVVHHIDKKTGKPKAGWSGNLRKMIAADKWDIVTIQQASPASWKWDTYQPYADEVIAAVKELAPQAEIRIQQTWSYCTASANICNQKTGGPGGWGIDRRGMYEKLTENYRKLAAANGFKIIPTGLAVENFRAAEQIDTWKDDVVGAIRPDKDGKLKGDSIHLNGRGHYLQGLVWTGALFGVDVSKCTYVPKNIDPALAEKLRKAAADALKSGL